MWTRGGDAATVPGPEANLTDALTTNLDNDFNRGATESTPTGNIANWHCSCAGRLYRGATNTARTMTGTRPRRISSIGGVRCRSPGTHQRPQSGHPAATRRKKPKRPPPYHQTTEQLLSSSCVTLFFSSCRTKGTSAHISIYNSGVVKITIKRTLEPLNHHGSGRGCKASKHLGQPRC